MNYSKIQLKEFSLKKMVDYAAIVIIAKRGSGKSWITRELIYNNHRKGMPAGMVISPSDQMNGEYKKFFPDIYIHYDISADILGKVLIRQQEMMDKQKFKKKKGLKVNPDAVLVMDDCLAERSKWGKIDVIRIIMMNGRHYKLTYILTMQTPLGLSPDLRLNFDYVFLLKEPSAINRKKLWQNYASMFDTLPFFEKVFSKTTENFCCMVINNKTSSDQLNEQVFWFKAKDRKFRFGSDEFKSFHDKFFDKKYKEHQREALKQMVKNPMKKKGEPEFKVMKI